MMSKRTEEKQNNTRSALIAAGLDLFGEYGYNGTSTRMLVSHAGANISAIPYYFGSKKGLYMAVMDYIIERIAVNTGFDPEDKERVPEKISKLQAFDLLRETILIMAKLFVESDEPKAWAKILVREQANPTDAFDMFYSRQIKPVQTILQSIISTCVGINPEDERIKFYVHAIFSQMQGFLVMRENLLRHLNVKKLTDEQLKTIYSILVENTVNILKNASFKEPA